MIQLINIVLFLIVTVESLPSNTPLNILMIAVDDLRPAGKAFREPEILLPNLDALAKKSVLFQNAYVQAATCGVSRSSLLTSRRPDTTQVLKNGGCPFTNNPKHKDWVSLPQYFRQNGYVTAGMGKIFHPGVCEGPTVGEQKEAWSLPYYHAPCISLGSIYNGSCYEGDHSSGKITSIYANATANDEDMPDGMIAQHAIQTLHNLSTSNKPFFVAVGFHKPHLPHIAPQKYFDMYPIENVSLPSNEFCPHDVPSITWNACGEFKSYPDVKSACDYAKFAPDNPLNKTTTRLQRQAYFASASYSDAQIGKVLSELESLGLANSTVIALWGDHGWHIGENNEWAKHTAMTRANRAPLLFSVPGMTTKLSTTDEFVEFVDIFPTLADLVGLHVPKRCDTPKMSASEPNCTEGASLKSLIQHPNTAKGKSAVFGQWPKSGKMGYNIYTTLNDSSPVRYTEWVGYNRKNYTPIWSEVVGVELYNRSQGADPDENHNLANRSDLVEIIASLSKKLRAGWRAIDQNLKH